MLCCPCSFLVGAAWLVSRGTPTGATVTLELTHPRGWVGAQAAKYSKKGSQEAEAGLLAVDSLHKQVRGSARALRGRMLQKTLLSRNNLRFHSTVWGGACRALLLRR